MSKLLQFDESLLYRITPIWH